MKLHGPYRRRAIRCQGRWDHAGWKMKVYGIAYDDRAPRRTLVEGAKRTAADLLPQPAITSSRYGLGFLCAHQGRTADVAFVDWWEDEDELHHHMFVSEGGSEGRLRPARSDELSACSWDLAVIAFERDAWVRTILNGPRIPDPAGYLEARLNDDV